MMFEKLKTAVQTDRQTLLAVLHLVAENHAEVLSESGNFGQPIKCCKVSYVMRLWHFSSSVKLILQMRLRSNPVRLDV